MKKWIFFLRAAFPSWRFFIDAGPTLLLETRVQGETWESAVPPIKRSFGRMFLNPEGNFLHACQNHLLHFYADLAEMKAPWNANELQKLNTYCITHNLARYHLEEAKRLRPGLNYQFRIAVWHRTPEGPQTEVFLESPVYAVDS
ncbi:MAG: hypothetical protein K2X47_14135 [Bdellovibrionales bacterium]|nr:hypothetical protein [Bdellovibrionales bacterium]